MKLSAIVAMSENRVIGIQGQLPWRLPEDLKRFKKVTTGHAIIMGRKTFESIGRPLPNRRNLVISRKTGWSVSGVTLYSSVDAALESCKDEDEVFVIGGGELYQSAFSKLDKIYLTLVHARIEGDTTFPEFEWSEFRELGRETHIQPALGDQPELKFSFIDLERV